MLDLVEIADLGEQTNSHDAGAAPRPDGGSSDSAATGDATAGDAGTGTCPAYELDADGCVEGMSWSRRVAACVQDTCPTGSGYTADQVCFCDCWNDRTLANVYDPCRPGFLLKCAPRPWSVDATISSRAP